MLASRPKQHWAEEQARRHTCYHREASFPSEVEIKIRNVTEETGGAPRQVGLMKLQLNTVRKDYISRRYIPFNINSKLILPSLILMPKCKAHPWKTGAGAVLLPPMLAVGICCRAHFRLVLAKIKARCSVTALIGFYFSPDWQEHTCSNSALTELSCFPRADSVSDSPAVNRAVLHIWQKIFQMQPHASCCYLHTAQFPNRSWPSSDNSNTLLVTQPGHSSLSRARMQQYSALCQHRCDQGA